MKKSKYTIDHKSIRDAVLSGSYVVTNGMKTGEYGMSQLDITKCPCCGRRVNSLGGIANKVVVNQVGEVFPVSNITVGTFTEVGGETFSRDLKPTFNEHRVFGGKESDTYRYASMGDKCWDKFYKQISQSDEQSYNRISKFGKLFHFTDEVEKIRKEAKNTTKTLLT